MKLPAMPALPRLPDLPRVAMPRLPKLPKLPRVGGAGEPDNIDLEADLADQVRAIDHGLNESMADIAKRLELEVEADYWCCLVFQSRAQRIAFLEAIKLNHELDDWTYVDGQKVARAVGIRLPTGPTEWKVSKVKSGFAAQALPVQPLGIKKPPEP